MRETSDNFNIECAIIIEVTHWQIAKTIYSENGLYP
ncbi:hypothetical protein MGSAQ_000955 [marine sediment metagenome]|uniref:Uncharacterized protein n=1 Tax=marine sediment metagenome TaxID=412755 RepID=A0A1B6NVR6_9ZZZZ